MSSVAPSCVAACVAASAVAVSAKFENSKISKTEDRAELRRQMQVFHVPLAQSVSFSVRDPDRFEFAAGCGRDRRENAQYQWDERLLTVIW